ncbi:hypothetical protein GCM10015536_44660 [Streptomyces griseomycini]|nr:hypothetical protein GCM10015536_44660 [Streptomyces griseomycini]
MTRGRRIACTVIFAPIPSVPTPPRTTDIDNSDPEGELWQEHHDPLHATTATGGHGMPNKIEIRPLDKKETTGDSGGNGGA